MPTWDKSIPARYGTDTTQDPVASFAPIPFSRVSVAILNVVLAWLSPGASEADRARPSRTTASRSASISATWHSTRESRSATFSEALDPDSTGGSFEMAVQFSETDAVGFTAAVDVAVDGATVTVGVATASASTAGRS